MRQGVWLLNTVLLYHPLHPCLTQACHQGASGNGRQSAADESRQGTLLIWHTWSVPVVHSKITSLVQLSTLYSQGGQRPAVLRTGYTDSDPDRFCYRPYASVVSHYATESGDRFHQFYVQYLTINIQRD